MRHAWQVGREEEVQPIDKIVGSDGSMTLAQNAPRRIVTLPNGEPGLSDRHTTITVIQAIPTPVPTPRPRPTPLPTPVPKQETRIQTTVNGLDNIETRAVLPEGLAVDQLDAVKKITDNGTLIAQQRAGLEQYKITQDVELEYLRIVKSFVLWGFLAYVIDPHHQHPESLASLIQLLDDTEDKNLATLSQKWGRKTCLSLTRIPESSFN